MNSLRTPAPPRRFVPIIAALCLGTTALFSADSADDEKITPPTPLKRVMPVHPFEAQNNAANGEAVLECLVTETGAVMAVQVVSASQPEFGRAAEIALQQWEFKPGEKNGHPMAMRVQVPFEFKPTLEQLLESKLKRPVFQKITGTVISARELPAWPRPLEYFLPRYPESLKGSGKYGKAVVSIIINKEGKVMNPTIVKATYPEFVVPSLITAARLEFPPQVMANNERIYVSMDIQFDFKPDGDRPLIREKAKKP